MVSSNESNSGSSISSILYQLIPSVSSVFRITLALDTGINHFYEKLLKLKELMNTEEAKRIAKARHEFMQRYLEEFFEKWKVKK